METIQWGTITDTTETNFPNAEEFFKSSDELLDSDDEYFDSSDGFSDSDDEFFDTNDEFYESDDEFFDSSSEYFGSKSHTNIEEAVYEKDSLASSDCEAKNFSAYVEDNVSPSGEGVEMAPDGEKIELNVNEQVEVVSEGKVIENITGEEETEVVPDLKVDEVAPDVEFELTQDEEIEMSLDGRIIEVALDKEEVEVSKNLEATEVATNLEVIELAPGLEVVQLAPDEEGDKKADNSMVLQLHSILDEVSYFFYGMVYLWCPQEAVPPDYVTSLCSSIAPVVLFRDLYVKKASTKLPTWHGLFVEYQDLQDAEEAQKVIPLRCRYVKAVTMSVLVATILGTEVDHKECRNNFTKVVITGRKAFSGKEVRRLRRLLKEFGNGFRFEPYKQKKNGNEIGEVVYRYVTQGFIATCALKNRLIMPSVIGAQMVISRRVKGILDRAENKLRKYFDVQFRLIKLVGCNHRVS